jgi:hypothetical protein
MKEGELLRYLGAVVLVIGGLIFIKNMMSFQKNLIEGFVGMDNNISEVITGKDYPNLKPIIQQQEDVLRVDKYRTKYEDMLIDMDEYLNGVIMGKLIEVSNNVGENDLKDETELDSVATQLNTLYTLKNNLNSSMTYIDSKKSKSSRLF